MRYSIKPKERKSTKVNWLLCFLRDFVDKYGQKLTDATTKRESDPPITSLKRTLQNSKSNRRYDSKYVSW